MEHLVSASRICSARKLNCLKVYVSRGTLSEVQNGCVYVSRETMDKRTKFVEKICEMFDFSIAIKK